LCRPSTTGGADRGKVVDGRHKDGHETVAVAKPAHDAGDASGPGFSNKSTPA
jgi:hypothetical protein